MDKVTMQALAKEVREFVARALSANLNPLEARVLRLETQLAALEKRADEDDDQAQRLRAVK